MHEKSAPSLLSMDTVEKIELRGLVNLLSLILLTYTVRAMIENYNQYGNRLWRDVSTFLKSDYWMHPENYMTLCATMLLPLFLLFAYVIELLASKNWFPRIIVFVFIVINLCASIVYPVLVSFVVESHPIMATYMMLAGTVQFLKIISFHHVWHDVRKLLREETAIDISEEVMEEVRSYPNNISFGNLLWF